ncbi:hypothetical protein OENI_190015 [Oenococcus oeni]|nr:hypothetical protein OENI_190015 [Oenococcus oeni]
MNTNKFNLFIRLWHNTCTSRVLAGVFYLKSNSNNNYCVLMLLGYIIYLGTRSTGACNKVFNI